MTVFTARQGRLLGKEHPGYEAVLGIPYAAPPVGDLRFRPPQQPVGWDGVRDGRIFGAACLQASTEYGRAQGSEDCLYLNVYKPAGPSGSEPLPVMVWLHGGGFVSGSGNAFTGGMLAQTARTVVVTANYRLGRWAGWPCPPWPPRPTMATPATMACWMRSRRCAGCATTSRRSAGTRAG